MQKCTNENWVCLGHFQTKFWFLKPSPTISDMATYFITGRKTTSSFHIKVRCQPGDDDNYKKLILKRSKDNNCMIVKKVEGQQQAEGSVLPTFNTRSYSFTIVMIIMIVMIMMMIVMMMIVMMVIMVIMMLVVVLMVKMRMVITVVVDCDYDDHAGDGGDNSGDNSGL